VAIGDAARWTHPPFGGEVDGERMYGRGACDNKGGIGVGLYTLARLRGTPLGGRVQLAVVADEESGACSELGLKHLLKSGAISPAQCEGAVYAYPGDDGPPALCYVPLVREALPHAVEIRYLGVKDVYKTKSLRCQSSDAVCEAVLCACAQAEP
jgi:acetylornithine deacetylase/succinyl-diaminopimelate desuccinylase-like protein